MFKCQLFVIFKKILILEINRTTSNVRVSNAHFLVSTNKRIFTISKKSLLIKCVLKLHLSVHDLFYLETEETFKR